MKHGKRPTRNQKKIIQNNKLNPDDWLVIKKFPNKLDLVHRFNSITKEIIA